MHVGWNSMPPVPPSGDVNRWPLWIKDQAGAPIPLSDHRARFDATRAAGVEPWLVLDRATFSAAQWRRQLFSGRMAALAAMFPDARYVEVGNEPDSDGPSSSRQARAAFYRMIRVARHYWPNAMIISGGLAGINYTYLDLVEASGADLAGVHPYGQTVAQIPEMMAQIAARTSCGVAVTEFGGATAFFGTEHDRAAWFSNMLIGYWQAGVHTAIVYRYDADGEGLECAGLESEASITDAMPAVSGPSPAQPGQFVIAIDTSDYQPDDLTVLIRQVGAGAVIVHVYADEGPSFSHTAAQLDSAERNGAQRGGYRYSYPSLNAAISTNDAIASLQGYGWAPKIFWIDCEESEGGPGPDAAWIRGARGACEAAQLQPGIYSRKSWWESRIGNNPEFSDLPLWAAQQDGIASLDNVVLFGHWTMDKLMGKQYAAVPCDTSIFKVEAF